MRATRILGIIVLCAATATGGAAAGDDAGVPLSASDAATAARGTLRTLLGQLLGPDRNMRRAAARSIDTLGAPATAAMAAELARLRPGHTASEVTGTLSAARRSDAADIGGRLDALLDLGPDAGGPAYGQTVTTVCLVRALADIGTPEAVAAFAPVALDARGAFAPEVTRHLSALGERATAGLVLMSHSRAPAAERWASSELEALGKRTPGDAVQTKSKEVLADVLRAYGAVHDADALSVVISFVNADRRVVRDAAREAITAYGDQAVPKLRESYGLLVGEAAPPDWPPAWLRRKLFEALDRVRLEDVDTRVVAGMALTRDGRFSEAVAAFEDVLARQPDWDRKSDLVPAYVFHAQSLIASDPRGARDVLQKALRLDPTGPRSAQIQSALALLEGRDLRARGIRDPEPFRRAVALDPGNTEATAELLRMQDEELATRALWRRRVAESLGGLATLCALILFLRPRARKGRR